MGLAMKTACCGKSLRTVSLMLLYIHFIVNAYALLTLVAHVPAMSYARAYDSTPMISVLDVLVTVIGCVIFLTALISIYQEKPSILMLNAATWFLIVNCFFSAYILFILIAAGVVGDLSLIAVEQDDEMKKFNREEDKEAYRRKMKDYYSTAIFLVYLLMLAIIAFKLYSALVFYSFKVDLATRPGYVIPPRQTVDGNQANVTAPYPPTVQYATPQYPTQSAQYPAVFPQYPSQQQPDYPYPAQPYPQAPPSYESNLKSVQF